MMNFLMKLLLLLSIIMVVYYPSVQSQDSPPTDPPTDPPTVDPGPSGPPPSTVSTTTEIPFKITQPGLVCFKCKDVEACEFKKLIKDKKKLELVLCGAENATIYDTKIISSAEPQSHPECWTVFKDNKAFLRGCLPKLVGFKSYFADHLCVDKNAILLETYAIGENAGKEFSACACNTEKCNDAGQSKATFGKEIKNAIVVGVPLVLLLLHFCC